MVHHTPGESDGVNWGFMHTAFHHQSTLVLLIHSYLPKFLRLPSSFSSSMAPFTVPTIDHVLTSRFWLYWFDFSLACAQTARRRCHGARGWLGMECLRVSRGSMCRGHGAWGWVAIMEHEDELRVGGLECSLCRGRGVAIVERGLPEWSEACRSVALSGNSLTRIVAWRGRVGWRGERESCQR